MKVKRGETTQVWLSANDTYKWAHRAGNSWPCSFLSGKPVYAVYAANGDLIDFFIDCGRGDQDCPDDELDAIMSDMLKTEQATGQILAARKERLEKAAPALLDACKCGGVGPSAIIVLNNAAGVLEELGKKYHIESCLHYAAELRRKSDMEFAAIQKAEGK